jgi:signal recognition particle receptor subunit beta
VLDQVHSATEAESFGSMRLYNELHVKGFGLPGFERFPGALIVGIF